MILDIILFVALFIEGWLLYLATQKADAVYELETELKLISTSYEELEVKLNKANLAVAKLTLENKILKKDKAEMQNKMNEIIKTIRRSFDK